jgi:DNA gyrase subunit A
MIINKSGIAIRMSVEDLRTMGRATQGVRLINLKDSDSIAAVAKVMKDEEDLDDTDILNMDVETEDGTSIDNGGSGDDPNTPETT